MVWYLHPNVIPLGTTSLSRLGRDPSGGKVFCRRWSESSLFGSSPLARLRIFVIGPVVRQGRRPKEEGGWPRPLWLYFPRRGLLKLQLSAVMGYLRGEVMTPPKKGLRWGLPPRAPEHMIPQSLQTRGSLCHAEATTLLFPLGGLWGGEVVCRLVLFGSQRGGYICIFYPDRN